MFVSLFRTLASKDHEERKCPIQRLWPIRRVACFACDQPRCGWRQPEAKEFRDRSLAASRRLVDGVHDAGRLRRGNRRRRRGAYRAVFNSRVADAEIGHDGAEW